MKVYKKQAETLLVKSKLPGTDYVVNPYTGCSHKCIYCYAQFMDRFNNIEERWGDYLIIKNPKKTITNSLKNKTVLLSSVTDPYCIKNDCTRNILTELMNSQANIEILTKSQHILDDIDLIKKYENIKIGVSMNTLDDDFRKKIEPNASSVSERLEILKSFKNHSVKTYLFMSPIFPEITNCIKLIEHAIPYIDEVYLENLNLRGGYKSKVLRLISENFPRLYNLYYDIYNTKKGKYEYWDKLQHELENSRILKNIDHKFYFHHEKLK